MSEGNGTFREVVSRVADVEEETRRERLYVREEFGFLRNELRSLKAAVDLLLLMAKEEERRWEAEHG